MPGNHNSGRRPTPPSAEDSLSEAMMELEHRLADLTALEADHARVRREQWKGIVASLVAVRNGWREVRGLWPDPMPAGTPRAA